MKMIRALIKPFKLGDVRAALLEAGVQGMTVLEAMEFGQHKSENDADKGGEREVDLASAYQVEVVVSAASVATVVRAISEAGITGMNGDGKIFVSSIDQALRIRTGETGFDAL